MLALPARLPELAPVYGITWNLQVMVNLQLNNSFSDDLKPGSREQFGLTLRFTVSPQTSQNE
jgi:hypothetical protein